MCIVAPEEVAKYKTANMAAMNFFMLLLLQKYNKFSDIFYKILATVYI